MNDPAFMGYKIEMKANPAKVYLSRIQDCNSKLQSQRKIETILIIIKFLITALGIFLLYKIAATNLNKYLNMLGGAALLFVVPAIIHEFYIRKRNFLTTVKSINEMEIQALNHEFLNHNNGEIYESEDNSYSSDLDLFGPKSVFHYINRTTTILGQSNLSEWLNNSPQHNAADIIKARQDSIRELSEKIDLRHTVQTHGLMATGSANKPDTISQLKDEPKMLLNKKLLVWFIHLLPLATLVSIGMIFAGLHWVVPVLFFATQLLINQRTRKKANRIYLLVMQNAKIFRGYSLIIRAIETADVTSPLLKKIKECLSAENQPASRHIGRLSTITSFFEIRRGEALHPLLNSLFLWDLHCILRIERWKSRFLPEAMDWFQSIGEFESLSSFANLLFNFPGWVLPEITSSGSSFIAESLGHFLIPQEERVCNDVHIEGRGNIMIITGPNMAGKSTFLKTIGINMVLALAGAPVCAKSCKISTFDLYSSMKVSDSLDKHQSLFYAELQKLKNILDAIHRDEKVFFLLDEMLKGTNALDRQAGAISLLKQLVVHKSVGIIATHDLELTKLEEDFSEKIKNFHFDGYIKEDKLLFDYKIKPGKCESFNALELMRKIGIDI